MKLFKIIRKNLLASFVLLLIILIPLYPKLPLVDIQNTWVYIRIEDFLVFFVLAFWFYLLLKKEVTLKSPLTMPIIIFWLIGAIATIHGVVIIFPTIADVFPNVALLSYLRHIEYLSLFFVAYSSVKSKKFVYASIWTISATLLLVVAYGFGQKYLSFPAFLTMNEEYAKGIPIIVSPLNRISSTFAGHYDLAAYLVLIIPILASLFFGFKNILLKLFFLVSSLLGFILLFMTVSRVSFFVLFISLFLVLLFHKKKSILFIAPIIVIGGIFFLFTQQSLLSRFGSTVKEVDVLVDAASGNAIGHVNFKPRNYLYDKAILFNPNDVSTISAITELERSKALKEGVPQHLIPLRLPKMAALVPAKITSTGESLPQGSSYINLTLSPVTKRLPGFFFEYPPAEGTTSGSVKFVPGEFLVKRASAYDLSFTTRFQGEWPNALAAFGRNLFFGSGYGSVSLAVDNNYYRMLGETGFLGTLSFISIFIVLGLYIKNVLPNIESKVTKAFVLGVAAGLVGLSLNAILIDVFEASKVAFTMWLIIGVVAGTLSLYQVKKFEIYKEIANALLSPAAIIVYLLMLVIIIFSNGLNSYFSGDDFTWFRWAADCRIGPDTCQSLAKIVTHYFFNSDGFFYRPGTKTYFLLMYPLFWLNQVIYHAVSIALHFIVITMVFLIARKLFKHNIKAFGVAFLFLIASGYLEMVYWISATGHLISAVFILIGFYIFLKFEESKKLYLFVIFLISNLVSLMFYEQGIVLPFLAISYHVIFKLGFDISRLKSILKQKIYYFIFIPNIIYLIVRTISHTHWLNGDYNYNLIKFPLNAFGNLIGYLLIILAGPISLPIYDKLRMISKTNIPISIILGLILCFALFIIVKYAKDLFDHNEKKILLFGLSFFVISLIPFLGLGNITFRYSYLPTVGIFMLVIIVINKIFNALLQNGKDIAYFGIATIFTVFCLFHIIQSQQIAIEWNGAGQKTKNFLTSIDSLYADSWSSKKYDTTLYFANIPIKNGNAWVFPVGLEDSIWFAFKNENIKINKIEDVNQLPGEVYSDPNNWVFKFESDGTLKRYVWSKNGPIEYEK